MPDKAALTDEQKARLYDRLIKTDVIKFRTGPREEGGKMVEKNYIEHGSNRSMVVD